MRGSSAPGPPPLLVSASRTNAAGFGRTLLGRSLTLAVHGSWQPQLAFANSRPLAEHYNQVLEQAHPAALILFCHDDVWLGDQPLEPRLTAALEGFDLVGVAGNRRRQPGQACWWLQPGERSWDDPHLVGSIRHGDEHRNTPSRFGPSPAPAALLDGVALAAWAGVLQAAGVRFDPQLPFHFYDLDVCRSAEAAGLRLGVWPLPLVHASSGAAVGSASWRQALERYQRKWREPPPSAPATSPPIPATPTSDTALTHTAMTTAQPSFEITTSRQFLAWMAEQRLSLAFTTYQIGKLFALGLKPGGELAVFERTFNRCMGLCPSRDGNGFWMSSLYQVWRFENMLGPGEVADGHDRLYVPQLGITTGDCDIHDIAVDGNGQLVMVNTLFSCLAATSDSHSFRPLWRPAFISRLAAEDRCHLNGLAMRDGEPAFVTAVAASDAADGWREHRANGGVLIDVQSHAIVATGLSMPHSPRWYRDRLWLCNSGSGEFGTVDLASGRFEPLTFCAGYLRGVAFIGDYALLGTSKPRHNKTFSGLPLDDALAQRNVEARCGLQVVDLRTGDAVHWVRFEGLVEELYDVITLPGARNPALIGFVSDEIRRLISMVM